MADLGTQIGYKSCLRVVLPPPPRPERADVQNKGGLVSASLIH